MNTTAWSIKKRVGPFTRYVSRQTNRRSNGMAKAFSIIPGMICSVDIKTGRKTILGYLLKPINKARQEAMSER